MSSARHVVVGTAGHIDHGKTSLVKALTGIDTDRLPEEKARGITIDLGFAFLEEPDGLTIEIVDVPGHERFVKNMLAGIGGIDLAMLVIAADEGVMPQTREHFAICSLLHIQSGLVALTKTDMVEPDWLELVREDVAGLVRGTFLEGGDRRCRRRRARGGRPARGPARPGHARRAAAPISCRGCRSTGSSRSRASAPSSPARSWPGGCASMTGSRCFRAACKPRCAGCRLTASP
jgi:selenocysteine-specific elongation factor